MTDTSSTQEEDEPKLSILDDIKKQAEDKITFARIGRPLLGNVIVTDLDTTARTLTEFAHSPSILAATEAINKTQELSLKLGTREAAAKLSEFGTMVMGPLKEIEAKVTDLKKEYKFNVGTKALEAIRGFPVATEDWRDIYDPTPRRPNSEIVALKESIKEGLQEIKADLINNVVAELVDKLTGKGIIDTQFKDQIIRCKYCGTMVVKVKNAILYLSSLPSEKCRNCNRLLESGDFVIEEDIK